MGFRRGSSLDTFILLGGEATVREQNAVTGSLRFVLTTELSSQGLVRESHEEEACTVAEEG